MQRSENELRRVVRETVLDRLATEDSRRREALQEFLAVSSPNIGDAAMEKLADMIPPLLPELYEKWVGMFADRLFETVPREQVAELCDGTTENTATLILVYIMFLESERMEQQIAEDLAAYGRRHSADDDMGGVAAEYLRARMTRLAQDVKARTEN